MTGAFNQRHLYDRLPRDLDVAVAEGHALSVIAFDVADFRDIIGMSGEREGDRVLAELTDLLQEEAPAEATAYRVGRDEFILVVADCSATEAAALAAPHLRQGDTGHHCREHADLAVCRRCRLP